MTSRNILKEPKGWNLGNTHIIKACILGSLKDPPTHFLVVTKGFFLAGLTAVYQVTSSSQLQKKRPKSDQKMEVMTS